MESDSRSTQAGQSEVDPMRAPVVVHVCSHRVRLVDADGISAKAIIDGIVDSGLLRDDSKKFIEEVRYSQVKVKNERDEKTVVTITEV